MLGGVLVISAEADTLRDWALEIGDLGRFWYRGESCAEPDVVSCVFSAMPTVKCRSLRRDMAERLDSMFVRLRMKGLELSRPP
jgi:hypothetical protein